MKKIMIEQSKLTEKEEEILKTLFELLIEREKIQREKKARE
jgi:hypothetical protein